MDNATWALILGALSLILAAASFFVKGRTVIEYKNDLRLKTLQRLDRMDADRKRLEKEKATVVKNGNKRHFMDDEGNIFGRHIIEKK